MQISLPDDLVKQLESRVSASTEFSTIEEYAIYVLTEVLKQTDDSSTKNSTDSDDNYTKDQEDAVKDRLESLGYLD
ncbi:MAG: hypothetical protein COW24_03690 [Candidatus Kerfeldbacteria bacterium CG15_BIG_FIL_POST_REV_8_21_14_020_45_12]|uniref:CopG family transcriptional regulator n=1 Tax=Candidatus Kerfeldbacteria bacterium CG15_BIG_FIL_POST_REV_8_21_14_020_45_12 TaxID=2014247 RepID=A0A2M7H3F5_9BACT|nr:MAG: hypothetical protein COW24_03690 [Candidatus Kerfeldbacteria bacterium CG15_BIG_FIL_POST_REV_8_21_14_020_45_12]PJA93802.1 MAG: hypothetical protein CO132_01295 [Candidatus Kerfeldbacteria bacterium CG_4_9_14_3_um_filter_45_8]